MVFLMVINGNFYIIGILMVFLTQLSLKFI